MSASALLLGALLAVDPTPGLEAEIEVVLKVVDVRVTDKRGNFAAGLERGDFEVREDGQLREVQTFEEIVYPKPSESALPGTTSIGFASPPRRFLVVLDRTRRGRPPVFRKLRERFEEFATRGLNGGDMMAVAQYSEQKSIVKDFSADPERIVENLRGGDVDGKGELKTYLMDLPNTDSDPVDSPFLAAVASAQGQSVKMGFGEKLGRFFQATELEGYFRLLDALSQGLQVVPGPKVVLLATGGFDIDRILRERGELYDVAVKAMSSLAGAGAQVYLFDSTGLVTSERRNFSSRSASAITQDSLMWLADLSGGEAFRNSNDYKAAFDRVIARETGYYSLGFRTEIKRDGKRHKVEVKVNKKGLDVNAPEAFMAPLPMSKQPETVRRVDVIRLASLRQEANGVEVAMGAGAVRSATGETVVKIGLHVGSGDGERDVHLQAEGWSGTFRSADKRIGADAMALDFTLPATAGVVNLAAAVRDRKNGKAGTAFLDLEVPNFAASPSASLVAAQGFAEGEVPSPTAARDNVLEVRLDLYQPMGREVEVAWKAGDLPIKVVGSRWETVGETTRLSAQLDVAELAAGSHVLVATLTDPSSGDTTTLKLRFDAGS